jgi:hypothetical protein
MHAVENRQIFAATGNQTPVSSRPVTVLPEPVFLFFFFFFFLFLFLFLFLTYEWLFLHR